MYFGNNNNMKKFVMLLLFFLFICSSIFDNSYSYLNVKHISLNGISSVNIKSFSFDDKIYELYKICSYNRCYEVNEGDLELCVSNFIKLFENDYSEEEKLIYKYKGYPITDIYLKYI